MGQQQLLLVILVTIIVGIATVVAINTFSSASDSANIDAVRQDMITFASSASGYFMKPAMLGGGGNSYNGLTFRRIAFPAEQYSNDNVTVLNTNGVYSIPSGLSATDTTFTLTAHPASRIEGNVSLTSTASTPITVTVTPNGLDASTWSE